MTTFEQTMRSFTRELEELKAAPTRSPSEMVTKSRTITIYPSVVGYSTSAGLQTLPELAGVVKITLDEPGFATATIKNDNGQRRIYTTTRGGLGYDGTQEFVVWIQWGSPEDAGELGGDPSRSKTIPLDVEITATCDMTLAQYRTDSWR